MVVLCEDYKGYRQSLNFLNGLHLYDPTHSTCTRVMNGGYANGGVAASDLNLNIYIHLEKMKPPERQPRRHMDGKVVHVLIDWIGQVLPSDKLLASSKFGRGT